MKAIFGTMNIGQQIFDKDAIEMLQAFVSFGGSELDTAYVYNDGACEELLGKCFKTMSPDRFKIATKVNPRVTGLLDYESVCGQLKTSLSRMRLERVDILYLHFPDPVVPIEEPIRACADLYKQGKFAELGVSNFPLSLIREMLPLCDQYECPRPSVFEGVYNVLSRKAEGELFPVLDDLGMRFYAYNPLAGGMLTGRYNNFSEKPEAGRFSLRPGYQGRYWKESFFEAIDVIAKACNEHDVPMAEVAYRWLGNHSSLSEKRGDGVIVGASRMNQLQQNMMALDGAPLPNGILEALDTAWVLTEAEAPEYYRYHDSGKDVEAK